MNTYKIIITKFIENPNYEEEKKQYDETRYGQRMEPIKFFEQQALTTTLNEEEFNVIRKACIENFK